MNMFVHARLLLHVVSCVTLPSLVSLAETSASPAPYTIEGTSLVPMQSAIMGRDYLLHIYLPPTYESSPEKRYPVVYMTDAYWNFAMMQSLERGLLNDGRAPEFIIVGIGYADTGLDYIRERAYELTPDTGAGVIRDESGPRAGGSQLFVRAFRDEIIPYVDSNLRTDPGFRVLAGHSLGGLFCLVAMYEEPGLFQGFIATSPAVLVSNRWIFRRESELRSTALGRTFREPSTFPPAFS
jgi:predicted alpha/beta superfamily hydrolase